MVDHFFFLAVHSFTTMHSLVICCGIESKKAWKKLPAIFWCERKKKSKKIIPNCAQKNPLIFGFVMWKLFARLIHISAGYFGYLCLQMKMASCCVFSVFPQWAVLFLFSLLPLRWVLARFECYKRLLLLFASRAIWLRIKFNLASFYGKLPPTVNIEIRYSLMLSVKSIWIACGRIFKRSSKKEKH